MDSGAEKLFAICLDEAKIKWNKNNTIFYKYIYNGKNKKYYPDFYLPDYKLWVEIKGKKYIEEWLSDKINAVRINNEKIILIFSYELKDKEKILNKIRS